jgi:hypothetical protein
MVARIIITGEIMTDKQRILRLYHIRNLQPKKQDKPFKLRGVRCRLCKDVIYSRAPHDYRSCSCGAAAVDGGLKYLKISGVKFTHVVLKSYVHKWDLYNDWNYGINRFGIIKQANKA